MGTLLEIGLSNAVLAGVLAVPAAAATFLCRRPALTHALWLLVFLKLVTPPLVPVAVPWLPDARDATENSSVVASSTTSTGDVGPPDEVDVEGSQEQPADSRPSPAPAPEASDREPATADVPLVPGQPKTKEDASPAVSLAWLWIVAALWPTGSILLLGGMAAQVYRFQRLLRHARLAPVSIQELANGLARQLGLKGSPAVWLVPGAVSPMLWGLGMKPCLLFPASLLKRLEPEQLKALVVHELAHFRRRDHWVRVLELVVLCLYWWHPIVWWARRELHEAEEQCCDAWVVWNQAGEGRAYALALMQTVAFFSHAPSPLPAAASGIGHITHLRRRLTMIMQGKTPRSLSRLGVVTVLALGLLLPIVPLQAQVATPQLAGPEGADGNARKEKIELLKKAIKILEEQETAGHNPRTDVDAKKTDQIFKAKAALDDAASKIKKLHEQMHQAQTNLEKAAAVLRELTGRPVDVRRLDADGNRLLRSTPRGGIPVVPASPRGARERDRGQDPYKTPAGGTARPETAPIRERGNFENPNGVIRPETTPLRGRGGDLEKKLDRLLKEVDQLRRELRRSSAGPRTSSSDASREPRPVGSGAAPEISPLPVPPAADAGRR